MKYQEEMMEGVGLYEHETKRECYSRSNMHPNGTICYPIEREIFNREFFLLNLKTVT